MIDPETPTGTCGVCVSKDGSRSLVANLAAANNYKVSWCAVMQVDIKQGFISLPCQECLRPQYVTQSGMQCAQIICGTLDAYTVLHRYLSVSMQACMHAG